MFSILILDVGCGGSPRGDINVDGFPFDRGQYYADYDMKNIKMFVWSIGECLPFKDNVFNKVSCRHVLEHVPNPLKFLKELNRILVDKGELLILVPSEFRNNYTKSHLFTWCPNTLNNLVMKVFDEVQTGYTDRLSFIGEDYRVFRIFPFLRTLLGMIGLHSEIYAHAIKRGVQL